MITEKEFNDAATSLGIDVAIIKAVAEVESRNNGFLPTGEPTILFEPHIFWRQLTKRGIDPHAYETANADILYEKQGTKPYGRTSEQHYRLQRAIAINRDAALNSASWGRFQLMGFNWKSCGFQNLDGFITAMYKSEYEHLTAFIKFVRAMKLEDELKKKEWAQFAMRYNGSDYAKFRYDEKLKTAYEKYSAAT